jgi:dTDP-4-dehydrorhamnose 3,5-epimerase
VQLVELGRPDAYARLTIPPLVWYGFTCLGELPALVANCANLPHEPGESETMAAESCGDTRALQLLQTGHVPP